MKFVRPALIVLLGLFMAFIGLQKFTGDNAVFSYIAWQSGISLFEPGVRLLTGLAELTSSGLLLASLFVDRLRGLGAVVSLGVIGGAILFHLSPWLGINAPVAFSEAASAPYTQLSDYQTSPMLFIMAVVFFLISAVIIYLEKDQLPLINSVTKEG